MASKLPRQKAFFISGDGIDREVIAVDIRRYLGNDALVRPGSYGEDGRKIQGYYLTAYEPPTSAQLDQLRRDSARCQEERRRNENTRNPYLYPGTGFDPSYKAPSPNDLGIAPDLEEIDYNRPPTTPRDTYYSIPTLMPQIGYAMEPASITPNYSYSKQNAQRPAPIRSKSEPVRPVGGNIRDIKILHPVTGQSRNAGALLDTGCVTDNWITRQTVSKLGADNLISYDAPMKTMQAANMGPVKSNGIIVLDFRWLPKGVKVHTASFNVADAFHYDVIIGNEYIDENRLHKWDEDAFSPMTEHDPVISPNESEEMRQARSRQGQEKVDREEARTRAREKENAKRNEKKKERRSHRYEH